MSDFQIKMPERELTEAQLFARYTQNGGFRFDPVKQLYQYSFQMKEWYQTPDAVLSDPCRIVSEEFAVWNVMLWYRKEDSRFVCVEGYRDSAGFYAVHHEVCRVERELVTTRSWSEWLPLHPLVRQRFVYVHPDGSDPDEVWREVAD